MQKIPLYLAAAGMVLAKEVVKPDDPVSPPICGKGVVLTDSMIGRLNMMGVQTVTVEGHPVKMEGEKTLAESLEMLEKRFSRVTEDPLMNKLKEIFKNNMIKSFGEQDG